MTLLMRTDLRPFYSAAWQQGSAHPGLLIQRGLAEREEGDVEAKAQHVGRVVETTPGERYRLAYERWVRATADTLRFRAVALRLKTRLFIGLTGGAMLETGCAIAHSTGAPMIPGSATKGAVQSRARLSPFGESHAQVCNDLFGAESTDTHPDGLAGVVTFHDAWWIPGSAPKPHPHRPLVQEVVTTHHPGYYQHAGAQAPTDMDSPIPNAQIAAQGAFLFVLEGEPAWTDLVERMLVETLTQTGIGAKTRSGYGLFAVDEDLQRALQKLRDATRLNALPADARLREKAQGLTPKQIAEAFGTKIAKTREAEGELFERFRELVVEVHREEIESWSNETRQTNKARYRAYRNLLSEGGSGSDTEAGPG
jgi:CRISPR-associated protein Cmr6